MRRNLATPTLRPLASSHVLSAYSLLMFVPFSSLLRRLGPMDLESLLRLGEIESDRSCLALVDGTYLH